jgi:hypothetical protein
MMFDRCERRAPRSRVREPAYPQRPLTEGVLVTGELDGSDRGAFVDPGVIPTETETPQNRLNYSQRRTDKTLL